MSEFVFRYGVLILGVANLVGLGLIALAKGTLMTRSDFQKFQVEVDKRVSRLEELHEDGPDWKAINEVRDRLGAISGDMKGMAARTESVSQGMQRLEHQLGLVNEHLLRSK